MCSGVPRWNRLLSNRKVALDCRGWKLVGAVDMEPLLLKFICNKYHKRVRTRCWQAPQQKILPATTTESLD